MSQLFENIFEKYNVRCEVPKKRYRSPKSLTQSCSFYKKPLSLTNSGSLCKTSDKNNNPIKTQILHLDSSWYFNTNTKGKYYSPTRYKTLEIVKVKHNKTIPGGLECGKCDDDSRGKENFNAQDCSKSGNHKSFNGLKADGGINSCNKNHISNNLAAFKTDKGSLLCKQLSATSVNASKNCKSIELKNVSLNETNSFSENTFTDYSETKDSTVLATCSSENNPTELDLLLELIEQQEQTEKHKHNRSFSKCDDYLPPPRSCRKGGVQEMFERALKQEKAKNNFLKYDKKVGLRTGHLLTVSKIETSYGLTLATVTSSDLNKKIGVVVTKEMAPRLKSGTQIEAFLDDKSLPYQLPLNGECLDVYLEPLKLLIV